MILAFMTKWGKDMPPHMAGKPTYFPEKIWSGMDNVENISISDYEEYNNKCFKKFGYDLRFNHNELYIHEKITTIRTDEKDRWKAGNDIHFYINNRTKDMFQFAPVIKCVSTQRIVITSDEDICESNCIEPSIIVDNKPLSLTEMELLAINDGFDSLEDFLAYFNTDFTGKIIHWTSLKY